MEIGKEEKTCCFLGSLSTDLLPDFFSKTIAIHSSVYNMLDRGYRYFIYCPFDDFGKTVGKFVVIERGKSRKIQLVAVFPEYFINEPSIDPFFSPNHNAYSKADCIIHLRGTTDMKKVYRYMVEHSSCVLTNIDVENTTKQLQDACAYATRLGKKVLQIEYSEDDRGAWTKWYKP